MRKITIVGAGQSGLMVACGLIRQGYDVTVVSASTADEIRNGRVLSSQGMFWQAIENEQALGLRLWEDETPPMARIEFNVLDPEGNLTSSFCHTPAGRVESIDQRVKMPGWMDRFEELGGKLVIERTGIAELERYASEADLVCIATGKGDLRELFERDADKSPYDKPMRALALTYVTGMEPVTPRNGSAPYRGLTWNGYPGVGEYFCCNALTTTGLCEIMIFEGLPGGPMDCWSDVTTPAEHLERSLWILETYFPWEAERCRNVALTDDKGILTGRFPPTVRKPVAHLPSGRSVMGIGDTVCLNDPLTGQGANNANKFGKLVHDRILAHGEKPFDVAWMQATFDAYWAKASHVVKWTNSLLVPPPEAALKVLAAAEHSEAIADRIIHAMNDAEILEPWFYDSAEADRFINATNLAA